jgi:multiple sugar transport system ATP-binding protein
MAAISCEGVTKVYPDGTTAVDAVDLEMPDGQLTVLVGPSGCGKTTLLRMIAGLEKITAGTIRIGGKVVNDVAARDRDIAMVFQSYALYPQMSVYDNIGFGLMLRHTEKRELDRAVRDVAARLRLTELLAKKPGQLSGGQRQRVAMGRAIVRKPEVFLLDEPLSNLDAKLRHQMRAEVSRLQRDLAVTSVYVTHDQVEAMTLGDQVAVLRAGTVQQLDRPQALYREPTNLFVAGFIGAPAMNLLEAQLSIEDGELSAAVGDQRLRLGDAPAELRAYEGRTVVLGIRPEHLEDASVHPDAARDVRLRSVVDLREEMGNETHLYFSLDAPPVLTEDIRELQADIDEGSLQELEAQASARRAACIACVDADSRTAEGDLIELVVDVDKVHFFDLDTGDRIAAAAPVAVGPA